MIDLPNIVIHMLILIAKDRDNSILNDEGGFDSHDADRGESSACEGESRDGSAFFNATQTSSLAVDSRLHVLQQRGGH